MAKFNTIWFLFFPQICLQNILDILKTGYYSLVSLKQDGRSPYVAGAYINDTAKKTPDLCP